MNSLCNKKQECALPLYNDSATFPNNFGDFFSRKIDLLREEIDSIHVDPPQIDCHPLEILFQSFSTAVAEDDVCVAIMSSSNTSCQLDLIPTWLLKLCINELAPVITDMVNLSFVSMIFSLTIIIGKLHWLSHF